MQIRRQATTIQQNPTSARRRYIACRPTATCTSTLARTASLPPLPFVAAKTESCMRTCAQVGIAHGGDGGQVLKQGRVAEPGVGSGASSQAAMVRSGRHWGRSSSGHACMRANGHGCDGTRTLCAAPCSSSGTRQCPPHGAQQRRSAVSPSLFAPAPFPRTFLKQFFASRSEAACSPLTVCGPVLRQQPHRYLLWWSSSR